MRSLIDEGRLGRIADNPVGRNRLIRIYLETASECFENIEAAFARPDFPKIAFHAHALKGASMAIGADRLAGFCGELQDAANSRDAALTDELKVSVAHCYRDTVAALVALIENSSAPG